MTNDPTPSIKRINPPELGTPPGYSQIVDVRAGRIIFIAGQTALNRDGTVVGKVISRHRRHRSSPISHLPCRPSTAAPPTWSN